MVNLNFRVEDAGVTNNQSFDEDTLVKDFISSFLSKNQSYNTTDPNIYTFKVGAKVLNTPRYMNTKLKDIIKNGGLVKLFRKQGIHYSN